MVPAFDSNFPSFKAFARLNSLSKNEPTQFFDCEFYPYTLPGVDPVFAVVGKAEVLVCRPSTSAEAAVEVIAWFHEEDLNEKNVSLNSCTWSRDPSTGDPWLCVTGSPPSIKILNVKTGKLVKTLVGHGKNINDLAVSPISPDILASASEDLSVRFWSLDPKHEKQPCMLICSGEGHKEGLLTMAFHPTGRYLLTGGLDCVVNLWVIPDLPNEATGTDKPTINHYPHFSTSAIHTDYVDCIVWYNDLILSKCAIECKIILWRIEGFDSSDEPPSPSSAPTTHEFRPTRSAFGGTYQRLLQFDVCDAVPFYIRFSLFAEPGQRPILVVGNEKSRIFFWDLQSLEEWSGEKAGVEREENPKLPKAKKGVARKIGKQRESSIVASATTSTNTASSMSGLLASSTGDLLDVRKRGAWKRYDVSDPFKTLLPHHVHVVQKVYFSSRQVAWSQGGEWMVVVGDQGMIVLFSR